MAAGKASEVPAERSGSLNGRRLGRRFLSRPSFEVAPDLIDCLVVRETRNGARLVVRLVETEAYTEGDPASHSFHGRTPRNEVMFGAPGHLYVYFTYGMHFCMNVVTGRVGEGSAVLLRAAEPLEGLAEMSRRRGTEDARSLCSGPARLCQALGIGRRENGIDLVAGRPLYLLRGSGRRRAPIGVGPRVGIRVGGDRAWRFFAEDDPFVSRGSPGAARVRVRGAKGSRG